MTKLLLILLFSASLFLADPLAAANLAIRWTSTGDDGKSGTANQYDIRYSTSPITESNWATATQVAGEPAPQPAGSSERFVITGLKPGTTYFVAIKTADERPNWSALSNVLVKSTCPGICSGKSGNINGSADGRVDLSDLSLFQQYFVGMAVGDALCIESGNCDGDPNGSIDLADLTALISYLYGTGQLADCE